MAAMATAELTLTERAIQASSASAAYLDHFSSADRVCVPVFRHEAPAIGKRRYYSRGQYYAVEWQDYGQPLPGWFDPLMQGFIDVLTLPCKWDSYEAGTIDPRIVHEAMNFMNTVLAATSPAPRVVPLSSGGVQLEWHRKGMDLEVVFDAGDRPFFYRRNRESGEESEHPLPEDSALLQSMIGTLE